ncbi:hypothetical protein L3Q82_001339 [Scortum barcoo]|uniref:Uncharacterized protein n=1 Tax=Scortum barcoo TaxID=214431 RepID=A0ACB8W6V0_9TELE|nr:hypothetical protein L3Q82_001339 [Scortum barcoo]
MKCFERIILKHIKDIIPAGLDQYQFANRENRSTEDAVSIALHTALTHLQLPNTYLCHWIRDFLTNMPQVVRIWDNTSSTLVLSTGTPQGCVLSPALFTLFTSDCSAIHSTNTIVKFADDTTIVGLISDNDETHYREEIQHLTQWCSNNNLVLNTSKTKEVIVDYRRSRRTEHAPLLIHGEAVERVNNIKFLGIHITSDLTMNTAHLGCWRKITIDDFMPFDEENNLLLPASTCQSELWPMLLAKALIKVASTNVVSDVCGEMGEFTFFHTLTGWIPEIRPIKSVCMRKTWDFLQDTIPVFTHPDESLLETKPHSADPASWRDSSLSDNKSQLLEPEKSKGTPEVVVCASYYPLQPHKNSFGFGEMANSSEFLRQYGLSLLHSHTVLLTRTRACPLDPEPKPPPVPRWKLIRQRKEVLVTDEPRRLLLSKPDQFIEVASPFLSYRVKSSVGPITELEAKQNNQRKRSYGSLMVSIAEREESESREGLEPDPAEHTTNAPNSITDNIEVTAEDRKKDDDDISNDRPKTAKKEVVTEEPSAPVRPILQETWMDLNDFAKCFQTLLVFHKPQIYPHRVHKSHFKCPEVRCTHYLCVDSLQPSQILVSFSALLLWGDTAEMDIEPPESWRHREPTDREVKAVTILQAGFKKHLVQEILNASKPGTKENLSASKILLDMWPKVQADAEKHAALLLRYIIDHSERKTDLYTCQQDERNRITFADYSVLLQNTANSWVLVFREVFLVHKEMLLVPKVYSPIPNCLLHIINNDTGEEVNMVFNKVAANVYKPNKLGYTFVAEAVLPESPPLGANWRMRLIGSRELLPKLSRETPLNTFSVKEFRDYYIPNDKNLICRCLVQVTADVAGTIQFQTSKPDVLIHLSILDQEKEVASTTGKGHVVIPVFYFWANKVSSCTDEKHQNQKGSPTQDKGVKVADTSQQRDGDDDTAGKSGPSSDQSQPPTETMGHKYVVQAEVLYKSWDLDESQLAFVHTLRDLEKNEMRVYKLKELKNAIATDTLSHDGHKSDTPKANLKGEGDKEKGKTAAISKSGSRHETNLDFTKPNWTLRVVSDKSETESIKVTKDTERLDQIKAIKKAWEMAEPGRCAKALQSRLKFLNQSQPQASDENTSDEAEGRELAALTSGPGTSFSPSNEKLTDSSHSPSPMDYTPFIRRQKDFPVLMDSQMEEIQQRERLEKIQTYRLVRDNVLEHQKQQELDRKELMRLQLEMYENLQTLSTLQHPNITSITRHAQERQQQHCAAFPPWLSGAQSREGRGGEREREAEKRSGASETQWGTARTPSKLRRHTKHPSEPPPASSSSTTTITSTSPKIYASREANLCGARQSLPAMDTALKSEH